MFTNSSSSRSSRTDNHLPFIPPPDYSTTIHRLPHKSSSTLSDTAPIHQLAVFTDSENRDHHVDLNNGKITTPEVEEPIEQEESSAMVAERKQRVLKMLQAQGVPVFPGLKPTASSRKTQIYQPQPSPPAPVRTNSHQEMNPVQNPSPTANAHVGPTRAFYKHLENHRKFATMKNLDSCAKCPICKQMLLEIDLLSQQQNQAGSGRSRINSIDVFKPPDYEEEEPLEFADDVVPPTEDLDRWNRSSNLGRGSRPSTSDDGYQSESQRIQYQSITPEFKQNLDSLPTARARYDWQGHNSHQLSIRYGETLQVTKLGQTWVECINKKGHIGWIPSSQLYLMPLSF